MVPLAVVAASLLINGVANSAPPATAPQATQALAPTTTMTKLDVSQPSPVTQGTRVTLIATITPSTAVGTVQFLDGTTPLGAPVQVGDGTARGSIQLLTPGTRSLTAVFTPADSAAFSPSTSPAVNYVVAVPTGSAINTGTVGNAGTVNNAAAANNAAMGTTTALMTSPAGMVAQGTRVTLIATITPSSAVGTVQFLDGATPIGAPVQVSNNGTASGSTAMLTPGLRQLTAVFVPADPTMFTTSTSPQVPLMVTGQGVGFDQTGTFQQSGLSLDVQVNLGGDLDGRSGVLGGCGCPYPGGSQTVLLGGRMTTLDGRPVVLDGNGTLGSVLSVALGMR